MPKIIRNVARHKNVGKKKASHFLDADFLKKFKHNATLILKYSNATVIKTVKGLEYYCGYCDFKHPTPHGLKSHNLDAHESNKTVFLNYGLSKANYTLRLDLTDFKCNICNNDIDNQEKFLEHIREKHDHSVYNIKNQIVPFKFETDELTCFLCKAIFGNFKYLLEHMPVHYSNFICDVCGSGYISNTQLQIHKQHLHETGVFPCEQCPKIFKTVRNRDMHNYSHRNVKHFRCWQCPDDRRFRSARQKEMHMINVHGVDRGTVCHSCNKTFSNRTALNVHVRRMHLLERSHKCPRCEMRFFSSSELKDHAKRHTISRSFDCQLCDKKFVMRFGLKLHMLKSHRDAYAAFKS